MPTITTAQLNTVLFSTEVGNDRSKLNTFSYAGNGTSSYSFGVLQFDVATDHGGVQQFLKDNGFSEKQIDQLSQQGGLGSKELGVLDKQLQGIAQDKMDGFVNPQLQSQVDRIGKLEQSLQASNPSAARAIAGSPVLQLALADYDNQFSLSNIDKAGKPNTMKAFLEGQSVKLPGGELQAGDPLTRADIQSFIDATKYGQENPRSVQNREQRLDRALNDLNLTAQQGTPAPTHGAVSNGASAQFLEESALFKQAQTCMQAIDARFGRTSDLQTDNAAGYMAVKAHGAGMTRIDVMDVNDKGDKIIAAQGQPGSAHCKVVDVPTMQALNTPLAQSSQAFVDSQQSRLAATPPTPQQTTEPTAPQQAAPVRV